MKAVRAGAAVEPSWLAPFAVSRARAWQVVPRRGSLTWFAGFAEVGTVGLIPVIGVLIFVSNRWGLLVGILAAVLTFVPMAPVSRREGAIRRERARDAELANFELTRDSRYV